MTTKRKMTFGIVVGNRGFFPGHLANSGREEMIAAVESAGDKAIVLSAEDTTYGAVETFSDAIRCSDLFKKHAVEIDGIIVTLPNFGDERGVADTLRPVSYTHLDVYKRQLNSYRPPLGMMSAMAWRAA